MISEDKVILEKQNEIVINLFTTATLGQKIPRDDTENTYIDAFNVVYIKWVSEP